MAVPHDASCIFMLMYVTWCGVYFASGAECCSVTPQHSRVHWCDEQTFVLITRLPVPVSKVLLVAVVEAGLPMCNSLLLDHYDPQSVVVQNMPYYFLFMLSSATTTTTALIWRPLSEDSLVSLAPDRWSFLNFNEVGDDKRQWHQLDHMQESFAVCCRLIAMHHSQLFAGGFSHLSKQCFTCPVAAVTYCYCSWNCPVAQSDTSGNLFQAHVPVLSDSVYCQQAVSLSRKWNAAPDSNTGCGYWFNEAYHVSMQIFVSFLHIIGQCVFQSSCWSEKLSLKLSNVTHTAIHLSKHLYSNMNCLI